MSKIIGMLVALAVVVFGLYSYVGWESKSGTLVVPSTEKTSVMPKVTAGTEKTAEKIEQEVMDLENAIAPSESSKVEDIAKDIEVKNIDIDLDTEMNDIEKGLENL